jgi:hypothetical protein
MSGGLRIERTHMLTGRKTQRAASNLTTSLIEPYLDGLLWMSLQGEEASETPIFLFFLFGRMTNDSS